MISKMTEALKSGKIQLRPMPPECNSKLSKFPLDQIWVRLPVHQVQFLKDQATQNNITLSEQIRVIIDTLMEDYTIEGLADAVERP